MSHRKKEIPRWAVCTSCCEKWAQSNSGLCRRCDRLRHADTAGVVFPKQVVAPKRTPPTLVSRHYDPPDPLEPRPVREVAGVLYVVTWCGTDCGGEALGIPPAGLRGSLSFNPSRLERYSYA